MAWHGMQATQGTMKPKPPTREEANLDTIWRVVGGEHLRTRRRRRLVEVHRPEHAHGGEADVVAVPPPPAAAASPRCRRQEEGQLVRVGVQRGVQEHVHVHRGGAGRLAGVAAVRGDRERAAAQDVARDGGPRELEPPRAAHEADGDPRGRGPARHRRHRRRRRWERDGGQAERGGEGERGRQEEQEWRQQRGQAAPRAEVVRWDRRRRRARGDAVAAAAAGLHIASFVVTHGPSRARPACLPTTLLARSLRKQGTKRRGGARQRQLQQPPPPPPSTYVRRGDGSPEGWWWWAGGAARVALRSRGPARCTQARGRLPSKGPLRLLPLLPILALDMRCDAMRCDRCLAFALRCVALRW